MPSRDVLPTVVRPQVQPSSPPAFDSEVSILPPSSAPSATEPSLRRCLLPTFFGDYLFWGQGKPPNSRRCRSWGQQIVGTRQNFRTRPGDRARCPPKAQPGGLEPVDLGTGHGGRADRGDRAELSDSAWRQGVGPGTGDVPRRRAPPTLVRPQLQPSSPPAFDSEVSILPPSPAPSATEPQLRRYLFVVWGPGKTFGLGLGTGHDVPRSPLDLCQDLLPFQSSWF